MQKVTLKMTLTNISKFSIDFVWENAQDMEHIGFLHTKTNYSFRLFNVEPDKSRMFLYLSLAYIVKRKFLSFIPLNTFGYRKIINKYEIWQVEVCPALGFRTFLKSTLIKNAANPEFTNMVDHVEITIPIILRPLTPLFIWSLKRHAKTQCEEDEPFRMRRKELHERGLYLPPSILQKSIWEEATENYLTDKKKVI